MRLLDWWRIRPFFDAAFYLERYPDVRQAGMNPLRHYLRHGAAEGRKPHRLFDPEYYLSCCPEARKSRNPLLHFIETGGRLGNPHPLFDCQAYVAANPEVAGLRLNPLLHYARKSRAGGLGADQGVRPTFGVGILDVAVDIAFWEDASGRLSFICEPQQAPFFRAMRFDQLSAQVKP
jgi:hypothetical protein